VLLVYVLIFLLLGWTCLLVAGVDEAGRGCVIGSLVVAGVVISDDKLSDLAVLGVKDSKLLSSQRRGLFFEEIVELVQDFHVVKVSPFEIDKAVNCKIPLHKLNRLEAKVMAKVIESLSPDEVYVDAVDIFEERFASHISDYLTVKPKIVSRHKADKLYPIVSAASILAKVERDREIELLKNDFGDFGSGYLHDKKTRNFLVEWLKTNKDYPSCVRKSWKPAKKALSERDTVQQKLF
jgi:ribonuclease HII